MAETKEEQHERLEKRQKALDWWNEFSHSERIRLGGQAMSDGVVVKRSNIKFTGREIELIYDYFEDTTTAKAIFGTIEFVERNGLEYAEIYSSPETPFYERKLEGDDDKIMNDVEKFRKELGVDSYVIPSLYHGSIIFMQKPKYPIIIF